MEMTEMTAAAAEGLNKITNDSDQDQDGEQQQPRQQQPQIHSTSQQQPSQKNIVTKQINKGYKMVHNAVVAANDARSVMNFAFAQSSRKEELICSHITLNFLLPSCRLPASANFKLSLVHFLCRGVRASIWNIMQMLELISENCKRFLAFCSSTLKRR